MIIGITGLLEDSEGNVRAAGAGKDAVADILTKERQVAKVALADPLKRITRDVYDFTYEQLWGPSEMRNAPDLRYIRQKAGALGSMFGKPFPEEDVYLTPRHALQQLGTEWGRRCYDRTWLDLLFRILDKLLNEEKWGAHRYDAINGLVVAAFAPSPKAASVPDLRFFNEVEAIRERGGKLVRVRRKYPGVFDGSFGEAHVSEQEVVSLGDNDFDYVIENYSTLDVLRLNVLRMFDVLTGRIMKYDEEQADVPPFMRKPR